MKKIRRSVFETNSSSSHSITIAKEKHFIPEQLYIEEDGTCKIFTGEFGWEEAYYHDAATKASYCATYVKNYHLELEEMLLDVIQKETKASAGVIIVGEGESDCYPWGYIDHQSDDVCDKAFESEDNLRQFIFNKKSVLITDNDNH